MGEKSGHSKSLAQRQEETEVQSQFLMQSMMTGVVQQLERIERVVEKFHRKGSLEVNRDGEATHTTPDDNFEALKAKLMALSAANQNYQNRFAAGCTNYICEWIERRGQPIRSLKIASVLIDTLNACEGSYQPAVQPVTLNSRTLQELTSRLAYANSKWHEEEAKLAKNPEAYTAKQLVQVTQGQQIRTDVDAVRGQLNTVSSTSYGGNPRSFGSENRQSGIVEEKVATENKEEQKQKLYHETENVRRELFSEAPLLAEVNIRMANQQVGYYFSVQEINIWRKEFNEFAFDYFIMESEEKKLSDHQNLFDSQMKHYGTDSRYNEYFEREEAKLHEENRAMKKKQNELLDQCKRLRKQVISRFPGETGNLGPKDRSSTSASTRTTGTHFKLGK